MIVAIDGPAGAGKSSVARAVAAALSFAHLDTGAMYRALTVATLRDGLEIGDPRRLADFVATMDVSVDDASVTIGGVDITSLLRSQEVTAAVAGVAAQPQVRSALLPLQRRLADAHDVVVEGRDIGTVVFPHAEVKVYLTASADERARRRARQLGTPEDATTIADMTAEISARDETDATRQVSPLQQASDAVRVDSTDMTLDEVVATIVALVRDGN